MTSPYFLKNVITHRSIICGVIVSLYTSLLVSCVTLTPVQTANLLHQYVVKEKKYDEALVTGKNLTQEHPSFSPGWYWYGVALYEKGRNDEAIAAFKRMLELNPGDSQKTSGYFYLTLAYTNKGDINEAFHWAGVAMPTHSDYAAVRYARALGFLNAGKFDEAFQNAEIAIGFMDPKSLDYIVDAGRIKAFSLVALGKKETALEVLKKHEKENNGFWDDMALFYYLTGNHDALERHFAETGYAGVEIRDSSEGQRKGCQAVSVVPGSPAEAAGVRKDDIILTIDGTPVLDIKFFMARIQQTRPGTTVNIRIARDKEEKDIALAVGSKSMSGYNFNRFFTPVIRAKKERLRPAEEAEKQRDTRKAFLLYMEAASGGRLDSDLTRRIAVLAGRLDPPPAVPEEARKYAVFGMTAVKEAKDPKEFDQAIAEYRKAIALAPWIADLHYNLALAQEQRGSFIDAAATLGLYISIWPNDPQVDLIRQKFYECEYKAKQR